MSENNKSKVSQKSYKKKTFNDFDKLNLKPFAEELLQNMEQGIISPIEEQGAYTISLNAEFGNGKTTFLKMFKHFVKNEKNQNYNVISINAWESDFYKEPVIAILSEFVNYMKENNEEGKGKKLIETIGKIGINIGNQFVQAKTGINLKEIKSSLENGNNLLEAFNQRKEAIKDIKIAFSEYTKEKKLLIIVDELDRARPDHAVHFLEDMKHFFDIENVIFLVAVNRSQMEITVKCLYGQDLDFNGYYRKFFKQERDLPDPYEEAQRFVNHLIQNTGMRDEFNSNKDYKRSIYYSCKIFNLTLREIEHFMDKFESVLGEITGPHIDILVDCYSFFICLFIKENGLFKEVLQGNFKVKNLLEYLKEQKVNFSIEQQDDMSLINLLQTIICSLTTSESEDTDIFELMKIIVGEYVSIPVEPDQETKDERDRCYAILDSMHRHGKPQRKPYNQFALEICNVIKKGRS